MPSGELITVIVPAHRAEATIEECIRSILDSDYPNLEICAVVDPEDPTDGVLRSRFGSDARVRILNRRNEGVSSMRNYGLAHAQGSWIAFADADDTVSRHYLSGLAAGMQGADCAVCSFRFCRMAPEQSTDNRIGKAGLLSPAQLKAEFWPLFDRYAFSPCWNKLFRREIIEKHRIQFPEGQYMGEDLVFALAYLGRCSSVCLIDEPLYEYHIHPGQTIFRPDPSYFDSICLEYQAIQAFLAPVSDADEQQLKAHFHEEIKRSAAKICQSALSRAEKKDALCRMAQNRMVSSDLSGRRDLYSVLIRRQASGMILAGYEAYRILKRRK